MYPFRLTIEINASPARVWRALSDPREVLRWDRSLEEALAAPEDYPKPGQHVRWLCRSGFFRILHDRPLEVVREQRLRSLLSIGLNRYDETYMIEPLAAGCRLIAAVSVWLALPVVH